MIYVIGSGPSGVSAAVALIKQGHRVTMLDAGLELEPERQERIRQLLQIPEFEWDESKLQFIKENVKANVKGIPVKLAYGSDFPYKDDGNFMPVQSGKTAFLPSFAKGGFSNVWGGAVLPFTEKDIKDWPIKISDLEKPYKEIFSFLELAAYQDELEEVFPLYAERYRPLIPSSQATAMLYDLRKSASALRDNHIRFGMSRLAVRSYSTNGKNGCVYCGCCLYGCPHELVYNSKHTLVDLLNNPNFAYIKDIIVERVEESKATVIIRGKSRNTGERVKFKASRVYIGCGVLPTTKIMLESMEAYDKVFSLKGSQYFLLPLIHYKRMKCVTSENLHTLAQIFIEITDKNISARTVHLQLYTYNDLFLHLFRAKLGRLFPLFALPIQELLARLLVLQGYLHSDLSSSASIYLTRNGEKRVSQLHISGNANPQTRETIRKISNKLISNRRYLRFMSVSAMLKIGEFGAGYHTGGIFPMKHSPSDFETDILGRPYGFKRVHIIDSTIFPSIPATTITLSVMANAYRIASAHGEV